jgi:MFS transporter, DHA2 family, multidrug resistance protein
VNVPGKVPMKTLLAAIFVLNFIEFLQTGMMVFAAAPIMGEIASSPEEFALSSVIYACVAIAGISQIRTLVERFGWRRYVQVSIAVFALGALLTGTSHAFWQFVLGRAVMALGGGGFMTVARLMINLIPAGPKRAAGIGAFGMALAGGTALAPWGASLAVVHEHWGAILVVLIGLAFIAAILVGACLPLAREAAPAQSRFRILPLAWLLIGSFCVLYALQRSFYDFHTDAWPLLAWLAVGLAAIGAFMRSQLRQEHPFLRLGELVQTRFLFGLGVFAFCYFVLGATNAMVPTFLLRGLGVPLDVAGEVQTLGMLSAVVTFIVMVNIVARRPAPKKFYVAAFGALFLFAWRLSGFNGETNIWTDVVPALAFFGMFLILAMATTALHAFRDLQHDEALFANGQQLKNMLAQFGLGLGVAFATVGFQWRVTQHYAVLSERFVTGGAALTSRLEQLGAAIGMSTGSANAPQLAFVQLAQQLGQQATLVTSVEFFWLLMWCAAGCAAFMLVQRVLE